MLCVVHDYNIILIYILKLHTENFIYKIQYNMRGMFYYT